MALIHNTPKYYGLVINSRAVVTISYIVAKGRDALSSNIRLRLVSEVVGLGDKINIDGYDYEASFRFKL
ncbi:hypothetical protein [Caldivirga maquilingensis]|uniref:Uncharacterized protein n=1 Tax=Caldivirga maquilingensis (strain ATCC 700844 / DSM 13496 / JCM 10307 / IC-167) TaxID=397948 RepID=A8MAP7_CALMQ|nr:hypothetical protein [Caldivirga maquilingensis]ABW01083.1 hypothetical protein Cmaq_0235 [Caldivirga maquilingensis IC-167]